MTINGKADGFTPADFRDCAQVAGLKRRRDEDILAEVIGVVKNWPRYAEQAGVPRKHRDRVASTLRLRFVSV